MKFCVLQAQCRTWETFYSLRKCEGGACHLTDRTGLVCNISYFGAMVRRGGVEGGELWVLSKGKLLRTSTFLTLTLVGEECSALHPGRLTHGYRSHIIHRIKCTVVLRVGMKVLGRRIS